LSGSTLLILEKMKAIYLFRKIGVLFMILML